MRAWREFVDWWTSAPLWVQLGFAALTGGLGVEQAMAGVTFAWIGVVCAVVVAVSAVYPRS